jgi:hypothetical protein
MTNEAIHLKPFPRRDFIPHPAIMDKPERLRYLIETHSKIKKKYRDSYRSIVEILDALKQNKEVGFGMLNDRQQETLTQYLIETRNETARFYTQALKVFENLSNELAPGTFPIEDTPVASFDLWQWIDKTLDWFAGLCREIGDVLGHFGLETGEELMDSVADGIIWAKDRLKEIREQLNED